MAKIEALKTGKRTTALRSKGEPPKRAEVPGNLDKPARNKPERKGTLQFPLSEDMLEAFTLEAVSKFGGKKGSKTELFMEMWRVYQANKS